jgi:hypothetical protein
MKVQNERYLCIFLSKSQTYWKKLDNMIFSCYWRKTIQKKHFTNLNSLEKWLLFLFPLMYSLIAKDTITYLFVMIRKSVMKNSMVESLLSLLGHLGILTNPYDAVNSNKNSRTFTKPT